MFCMWVVCHAYWSRSTAADVDLDQVKWSLRAKRQRLAEMRHVKHFCTGPSVSHAMCSLYGAEKAKTNFPASEYISYFAMAANSLVPQTEPLANASQLVEELQQVVSL